MLKTISFRMMRLAIAMSMVSASLVAQTETIPQRIAAQRDGTSVTLAVHKDSRELRLDELAAAPLIVQGRLRRSNSYLSKDGYHIWTTYELLPTRVIVDRNANQAVPGARGPYTVTLYGGEIIISGIKAEVVDKSRQA